jgi:Ca2+-binding RTX toxin-like protein
MPQNIVGTGGSDTLTLGDTSAGVHTVNGLNGDDSVLADAGSVTGAVALIVGEGGFDTLVALNYTATISGGDGNDRIFHAASGFTNTALFGNFGSDTITATAQVAFMAGGDNSNDGHDSLRGSNFPDLIFGNGGNDTIVGGGGNNTLVAGFGNDSVFANDTSNDFIFGNEGDDTIDVRPGNGLLFAGQGNDSVFVPSGQGQFFLNEGNDTFNALLSNTSALTVVGGNDAADGNDFILTGLAADVVLGNGGADTIFGGSGNNVLVGGFGADCVAGGNDSDLLFGNQDNDTIFLGNGEGSDTVFAGQGGDSIFGNSGSGRATILGNEGNDTFFAEGGADTIAGGVGTDLFRYSESNDDGDGAAGGPIEHITDVNFAEDRFQISAVNVGFAAGVGTGNATTLTEAAANAIDTVFRQRTSGGSVAAVFAWQARTYLAIDTFGNGIFQDSADFLIDVTGAVGTVGAINFLPG